MLKLRLAVSILLAVATMAPAHLAAQEISQVERADIEARVAAFDMMMKEGRVGDSFDFIPPHLVSAIARKVGVTEGDLRSSLGAQMARAAKDVKFLSFGMDVKAGVIGTSPDKSRNYMLIPTRTVVELPGMGKYLSKNTTLAMKEGGQWYLVRIDSIEQIAMLREAYPEFAGVEFPTGSAAVVD